MNRNPKSIELLHFLILLAQKIVWEIVQLGFVWCLLSVHYLEICIQPACRSQTMNQEPTPPTVKLVGGSPIQGKLYWQKEPKAP